MDRELISPNDEPGLPRNATQQGPDPEAASVVMVELPHSVLISSALHAYLTVPGANPPILIFLETGDIFLRVSADSIQRVQSEARSNTVV